MAALPCSFREWPEAVLVTTDVSARGLDIPGVQHVVHYQIPRHTDTYIHRSGRTARAHTEGRSLASTASFLSIICTLDCLL